MSEFLAPRCRLHGTLCSMCAAFFATMRFVGFVVCWFGRRAVVDGVGFVTVRFGFIEAAGAVLRGLITLWVGFVVFPKKSAVSIFL